MQNTCMLLFQTLIIFKNIYFYDQFKDKPEKSELSPHPQTRPIQLLRFVEESSGTFLLFILSVFYVHLYFWRTVVQSVVTACE